MVESIHVQGEGGHIIKMDLPLPSHIAQRLKKGQIRRVNEDGSPYTGLEPTGAGRVPAPAGGPVPGPPLTQPAKNAQKADWVGWAVVQGADADEADAMTKADLIEKYGTPQPGE
jgi:hypothetical protein